VDPKNNKLISLSFLKHPFLGRRPGKEMSPRSGAGRRPTGSDLLLADPSLLQLAKSSASYQETYIILRVWFRGLQRDVV